ncbi:hypothetical protein GCM10027168_63850 [Streptomyces capparidis]
MSGGTTAERAWEELVTAALLGTGRRPPGRAGDAGDALGGTVALVDHADPARALLETAAVRTVHRRAGLRPAPARPLPERAPADPRPPLPPAARRRLALLLTERSGTGGGRGTAPNLAELLPQWLLAAREHGYRAPAELLPDLLDAARGRSDLRRDALALAGPRGLWLAALNPEWAYALRAGPAPVTSADEEAERRVWEEGLFAERVGLLARLRLRDPEAGLALLRSTWAQERAEDRLMFLDSLREGLSLKDEAFLEDALTDRSKNVRATAAELLSCLPRSALAARMADRARACVAPQTVGAVTRIVVEAPHECDAAMQRDGIAPKPPTGRGQRAWWLGQLVESTPLSLWTARFGLTPEEIVALPVADDWRGDLHAAWSRAAVRQRDAAWARALLGAPPPAPSGELAGLPSALGAYAAGAAGTAGDPAKLLSVLPREERAAWVARFIGTNGLSDAFQMLGVCAVPWAEPLGRAVVDALDIARDAGNYPWSFSGVMGLAERCLDPAHADRVDLLTAIPETDGSPGAGGYWSEAFQRLAATLRLRAAMLAELAGRPTAPTG